MYHYTDGGLTNVWLQNGYEVRSTPYGNGVAIYDLEGLVKEICLALAVKSSPLDNNEFRYIRSVGMLLSQVGLGSTMGVDARSVARWEKHGRPPRWADRIIRVLYIAHADGDQTTRSVINRINTVERLIHQKIVVRKVRNKGWRSDLVSVSSYC